MTTRVDPSHRQKIIMIGMKQTNNSGIGTLAESSLHAALKEYYALPGDKVEFELDGYVIDILRGETIIEIQTGNFSNIRGKLTRLCETNPVILIYPIPANKWIIRQTRLGEVISKRKSPKQGRIEDSFRELLRIADLIGHPNLTFRASFIQLVEIWIDDGQGSWRRKGWSIKDKQLIKVLQERQLSTLEDYKKLIPESLIRPFSNKQLAKTLRISGSLTQKMTYTLRKAGMLMIVGKDGRANLLDFHI